MSNDRYSLYKIISDDFASHNKVAVLLLILVVATAIGVVWITHQTRLLTSEQAKLVAENRKLDNRYVHLQLEENSQSQKYRVESVAKSLGLQPVKSEQEVILMER